MNPCVRDKRTERNICHGPSTGQGNPWIMHTMADSNIDQTAASENSWICRCNAWFNPIWSFSSKKYWLFLHEGSQSSSSSVLSECMQHWMSMGNVYTYLSVADTERLVDLPDHFLPGTADQSDESVMLRDWIGALRDETAAQHWQHARRSGATDLTDLTTLDRRRRTPGGGQFRRPLPRRRADFSASSPSYHTMSFHDHPRRRTSSADQPHSLLHLRQTNVGYKMANNWTHHHHYSLLLRYSIFR